jgi:hypothetical protein
MSRLICEKCGGPYEYSKLMDCDVCPICFPKSIMPFFMQSLIKGEEKEQ